MLKWLAEKKLKFPIFSRSPFTLPFPIPHSRSSFYFCLISLFFRVSSLTLNHLTIFALLFLLFLCVCSCEEWVFCEMSLIRVFTYLYRSLQWWVWVNFWWVGHLGQEERKLSVCGLLYGECVNRIVCVCDEFYDQPLFTIVALPFLILNWVWPYGGVHESVGIFVLPRRKKRNERFPLLKMAFSSVFNSSESSLWFCDVMCI